MDKLISARNEIDKLDLEMAKLFCKRMEAAKIIAENKAERALPVLDAHREEEIIKRNSSYINNASLVPHYTEFLKNTMKISRSYQLELYPQLQSGIIYEKDGIKIIPVSLGEDSYDILLGRGVYLRAGAYMDLNRKVLIVTDDGVPAEYAENVAKECKEAFIYTVKAGENSKNLTNFGEILSFLAKNKFTRGDCVVAVGGGVVGDLSGFVAASYMRGIDFYNIPTTLLSQIDSSIGGKVAIDLDSYKNTVGAFYQPKRVLIDPTLLLTLDIRQVRAGLAEALKMALTSDTELFSLFESGNYIDNIEMLIERSLLIKKGIVERDVYESGERKILNFGHTVGHAIESSTELLHGECVAIGMLFMCSEDVRKKLLLILKEIGLPVKADIDANKLYGIILRDKKADRDSITVTYVNEIGKAELIKMPIENIKDLLNLKMNGGIQ